VRIGVLREYMSKKLFGKADEESIDIIERALNDLRKLGATVVDPGADKELFQNCLARYAPLWFAKTFSHVNLLILHKDARRLMLPC
jgi:Asp-tRNA(Asn)/Glu-tRNA(Gln) amidotransferase A subunit family amidase